MTRYANDIQDGQLGAGTGAVKTVWGGTGPAPASLFPSMYVPPAPAPAPVSASGGVSIAVNGAGQPIRMDTAALDIQRLMGAQRGSGGAGTSIAGEGKMTPPNLLAADGPGDKPGESSAFPFAVNGEKKPVAKIEPKNVAILAALAAMFLM